MRVIAGAFKGRRLVAPRGPATRPTADQVRLALMDTLAPWLPDARVLDLFAGTGALGLEALSRGAKSADFVETRPSSLHALKANIATCRMRERTRVFKKDAVQFAAALTTPDHYGVTFADPPYESRQLDRVIASWQANRFSPVLAVEHAAGHVLPPGVQHLEFDDSAVTIYRR